ncbi:hypothetical protein Krac_6718 [Ktedonobacter racemifer DSM 44963]|uniref:Uncharacterized protein n=1 Tax=Ktedonobacter racemifer DSM 44963 TaxID=485913 RepID=D6TNW0_KTERA|nr:hypothetical protein Krac_6718 [Ktedonobacter racemifer DSM 44963]
MDRARLLFALSLYVLLLLVLVIYIANKQTNIFHKVRGSLAKLSSYCVSS